MSSGVRVLIAAAIVSLAVAAGSSCSKSGMNSGTSYPTEPGGGGGAAKELDSPNLSAGAVYQHRFMTAGSFAYHCIYHSPMHGTVQVTASAADTVANVSITSATMAFPAASVKPGGRVVWTNNTGVTHTVTSD